MKRKSLPTGRDFLFVEGYGNENPGAFQPTRPLRGATSMSVTSSLFSHFNPRAPCGARRAQPSCRNSPAPYFNPRAPCGARPRSRPLDCRRCHFNPRAPCGARQSDKITCPNRAQISTHAPLAGRDGRCGRRWRRCGRFQPTRPLRGATIAVIRWLNRH